MSDISPLLNELVAFSRHLRANSSEIYRSDLKRLEDLFQLLTYHVIYGERKETPIVVEQSNPADRDLVARRCGIEGCWGGPILWNISAGRMSGEVAWRCLAHIPPDITYPVSLIPGSPEWKATGRK